jgi:transposase
MAPSSKKAAPSPASKKAKKAPAAAAPKEAATTIGRREVRIYRNGRWYTRIDNKIYVEKCLKPLVATLKAKGVDIEDVLLMHDGASCHRHADVQAWMREHKLSELSPWPAKSPDLNPIENLWALLAERVSRHGPIDKAELTKFVEAEWKKLSQATVDNFVRSFRGRLQKCAVAQGEAIKP